MKIETNKNAIRQILISSNYVRFGLLLGITIIFTIILYPDLIVNEHSYSLGDVADKNIKAPSEFFIEDEEATEANRRAAVENILTVYDYNSVLTLNLIKNVNQVFSYLRKVLEVDPLNPDQPEHHTLNSLSIGNKPVKYSVHDLIWQNKTAFEEMIGITVSDGAYKILENENFSENINLLIVKILSEILNNGVVANKEILLKEREKGIVLRDVNTQTEKVVTSLKSFYSLDQAKTMVRIIGQPLLEDINYTPRGLIVDFVQRLIQPNITLNINETEKRKNSASEETKPILYKIKTGEMLLREGERVTEVQLLKLQALIETQSKGNILKTRAGGAMIIMSLLVITYIIYINLQNQSPLKHNKNLLFISCLLITFFILAKISATFMEMLIHNTTFPVPASAILFGIPLAAGAMTVCLFMGLELAIPFVLVLSLSIGVLFQNRFDGFLYHLLSSTMAAFWVQECRERKVFIKAGVKLGFLNMLLATVICVYMTDFSGFKLLWSWAFAFLGGIGSAIIASGLAPLIEVSFGYTTDITLLELANLDRPILRKLMMNAPGTYHHSVVVGSMAEAAASAIGANPLLSKVYGYYHDIGKVNKPLYFIENQVNGQNKHNKLAPSMSSLILISHVKEGVDIAKNNKLGQVIIDMIHQHHGTSLISYFYEKAKQLKGKDAVKIDDFRYPGPKPQTIEAGLVMLADVVEASARTLEDPTPSRLQGHVQNQINKVFADGQLDNCEMTLKDLHNIAKSFIKILSGIYHHRIDYPEKLLANNGKVNNGSVDRQQAKQVQDSIEESSAENPNHLKRLGLS